MKKFRFTLQSVLELRERQEGAAQVAHTAATVALAYAHAGETAAREALESHWQLTRATSERGMLARELEAMRNFTTTLQEHLATKQREARSALRLREEAAQKLRSAMQQKQMLENLGERQRNAYLFQLALNEQKMLDEQGQGRSMHGNLSGNSSARHGRAS